MLRTFTFSPDSAWLYYWRILITFGVLYTIFYIPFEVAFDPALAATSLLITDCVHAIFIADMVIVATTAFRENGKLIDDRGRIFQRYLKSTFFIDLVANFPFEIFVFLLPDHVGSVGTHALLSLPHMLRVHRLFSFFSNWADSPNSNQVNVRVANLVLVVAIVSHLVASAWYFLWVLEGRPDNGWAGSLTITPGDELSTYLHSLYWSATVLTTVGFGDIVPKTDVELAFTIGVMFIGVTLYAYVIGNIAALIPRLQGGRIDQQEFFDALRDFMRNRGFPAELQMRIFDYESFVWSKTQGDFQARLLRELPRGLRNEVASHLANRVLGLRTIFPTADTEILARLVQLLSPEIYPPGAVISEGGAPLDDLLFISEGAASVLDAAGTETARLMSGASFGGIAATTGDLRTARIVAGGYCSVLRLGADDMRSVFDDDDRLATAIRTAMDRAAPPAP